MAKKTSSRQILFGTGVYVTVLTIVSLLVYSTLFVKAYAPFHDPQTTTPADTQTDSATPSASTSDSITYKTWPESDVKATVLLDAGHGGMDGGNVTGDVLEKELNLSITNKIAKYLREFNPNLDVKVIREGDEVPWMQDELSDLNYRLAQQNEQQADYFFSIHANAFEDPTVEGVVFFVNPTDSTMKDLVAKIEDNMKAINWAENYNVIDYELLQLVTMSDIHSSLIELGYMTNPEDLAHLSNEQEQDKVARAIAGAISDFIMENPDAPKYEKPAAEKELEASMASEQSTQSAVDSAAARHQVEKSQAEASAAQSSAASAAADSSASSPEPVQ